MRWPVANVVTRIREKVLAPVHRQWGRFQITSLMVYYLLRAKDDLMDAERCRQQLDDYMIGWI
jgi:hypothetical protein